MNERIKDIRNSLALSQDDFGKKIGVTRSAVCNYENGSRAITEQTIKAICREFNVNEDWLRNGVGDMFIDIDDTQRLIATLFNNENDTARALFSALAKFDERDWLTVQKLIDSLSSK